MSSPVRTPRTPMRDNEGTPRSRALRSNARTPRTPNFNRNEDESSPLRSRSPRTPQTRTPRQQKTPTSRNDGNKARRSAVFNDTPTRPGPSQASVDTPLRVRSKKSNETMAASEGQSDGPLLAAPSSPFRVPQTSPYNSGGHDIELSSPLNYGTPSSMASIRTPRHGTPRKQRADLGSQRITQQVNIGETIPEENGAPRSSETDRSGGANLVIWGTDIVVSRCKEQFKRFIEKFIDPEADNDELPQTMDLSEPLYLQKLEEIAIVEEPFLNINCAHLEGFDENLYRQLIAYPQEVIPYFDMAVNEMFFAKNPSLELRHQIQVRPYNVTKAKDMRDLNPEDIDQLVTIHGMVIRTSNIIPKLQEGFFKCIICSYTCSAEIERGRITEPTLCTHCNNKFCFNVIHNRCQFSDKQLIKLQESPDGMPAGQTPHTVALYAHDDLVDAVHPGDRVTVTGVYRAISTQVNPIMSNVRSVYNTHIDVVHFRRQDNKRLYDLTEGKKHVFPPEREELLKLLSQKENIYERLARNIAPNIYENIDVKKAILLQLLGGTRADSGSIKKNYRSEINILLCGDPGTSKSQLLQYAYHLLPRSQYSSGKGSSAVGLTAYVTKDPETHQMVLQTGSLVLADNGICCIDEFDKMDDSTRSVLHEVMEQQTLSIAKAGIICQLNARTSILAAANPVGSEWDRDKTIPENVKLPPSLLSRFDLIFLMLDPKSKEFDRKLGRHLVSLYYENEREEEDDLVDMSILRDYIAYAKEHIYPILTDEAQQNLVKIYIDMRAIGKKEGFINAYPRQLESVIRLSEAHAKVRFSKYVSVDDVEEAYRLYREALKQAAVDPNTGKIDISILTTGYSESNRKRSMKLKEELHEMIKKKGKIQNLNYHKFFRDVKSNSQTFITKDMFDDALQLLESDGVINLVGKTTIRINRKLDLDD